MLAVINSCTLLGLSLHRIQIEVDVTKGLPSFDIVGLPDPSVRESRDRVRSAITNSGFQFPFKKITVNLAPADIRKEGPIFDLPIALGILAATEQIHAAGLEKYYVVGELSLSGEVRSIRGALAIACGIKDHSDTALLLPHENAAEASIIPNIAIFGLKHLGRIGDFLEGVSTPFCTTCLNSLEDSSDQDPEVNFSEIVGQHPAKRALEIAASGGHNLLFVGPPGSGKSMLAKAFLGVLPPMTLDEAIEVSQLYSICGLLPQETPLLTKRPFRSPHHNVSQSSIIGGGAIPKPGEISLATHGVLFLDEFAEFRKNVIEALRQPIEDKEVLVSRVAASIKYPAKFILLAALNPCPCGYYGDDVKNCICTPYQIKKYLAKISGPMIDRFDLQVHVARVTQAELLDYRKQNYEDSKAIKERIIGAKNRQLDRFRNEGIYSNAEMNEKQIEKHCMMSAAANELYRKIYEKFAFSMRTYRRILKVARSIADLDKSHRIEAHHLAEAIQYRDYDRLLGDIDSHFS